MFPDVSNEADELTKGQDADQLNQRQNTTETLQFPCSPVPRNRHILLPIFAFLILCIFRSFPSHQRVRQVPHKLRARGKLILSPSPYSSFFSLLTCSSFLFSPFLKPFLFLPLPEFLKKHVPTRITKMFSTCEGRPFFTC